MRQQYYLHIGSPKTGTTTIQRFMVANRAAMMANGIYSPDCDMYWPTVPPLLGVSGLFNRFVEEEALLEVMAQASASHCPKVVLSHEGCYFLREEEIARIRALLSEHEVWIICYLRRHDLFANALYLEMLKQLRTATAPDEWISSVHNESGVPRPLALVEQWARHFGDDHLIVVPFEKSALRPSLLHTFFQCFGEPMRAEYVSVAAQNMRPSAEGAALFMNLARGVREGWIQQEDVRSLLPMIRGCFAHNSQKEKVTIFTPEQQQYLMEVYQEDYREIARRFLHREDGVLFHDPAVIDENGGRLPPATLATYGVAQTIQLERRLDRLERKFLHIKIKRAFRRLLRR